MKNYSRWLVASLMLTALTPIARAITIGDYADSYSCFAQDKKHLSALQGVETYERIIRGIYFIRPTGNQANEPTATMKLCRALFHSVDNQFLFHATASPLAIALYFSPTLIAQIITVIEENTGDAATLTTTLTNLITNDPAIKKLSNNKKVNIIPFVTILVGACQESGLVAGQTPIYSRHTPYRLLQAFLYKQFTNKEDLKAYTTALKKYQAINPDTATLNNDHQHEQETIQTFSLQNLPVMDDYRTTYFTTTNARNKKIKLDFSDCKDNTMRLLISILAWDPTTNRFNPELLQQFAAPGKAPHPDLVNFFNEFATPTDANRRSLSTEQNRVDGHERWANLISNIPGITYVQAHNLTSGNRVKEWDVSFLHDTVLKNNEATLEGRRCRPLAADTHRLFEMEVSLRNVIVACNHLLGLGLFDMSNQAFLTEQEYQATNQDGTTTAKPGFFSDKFIEIYWKELCTKLQWQLPVQNLREPVLDFHIAHCYYNNSTADFTLHLETYRHADIKSNDSLGYTKSNLDLTMTSNALLHNFITGGKTKRDAWEILEFMLQRPDLQLMIADASFAYYQALITNERSIEDFDVLFKHNSINTCSSLSNMLIQLKSIDCNCFINSLINQSKETINTTRTLFLNQSINYHDAFGTINDEYVLCCILGYNDNKFNDEERQAALENPLLLTSTRVLDSLLKAEDLKSKQFFLNKIIEISKVAPDHFLHSYLRAEYARYTFLREYLTRHGHSHLDALRTTKNQDIISYALGSDLRKKLGNEEMKALLENPYWSVKTLLTSLASSWGDSSESDRKIFLNYLSSANQSRFAIELHSLGHSHKKIRISIKMVIRNSDKISDDFLAALLAHTSYNIEDLISAVNSNASVIPRIDSLLSNDTLHALLQIKDNTYRILDYTNNLPDRWIIAAIEHPNFDIKILQTCSYYSDKRRFINLLPAPLRNQLLADPTNYPPEWIEIAQAAHNREQQFTTRTTESTPTATGTKRERDEENNNEPPAQRQRTETAG